MAKHKRFVWGRLIGYPQSVFRYHDLLMAPAWCSVPEMIIIFWTDGDASKTFGCSAVLVSFILQFFGAREVFAFPFLKPFFAPFVFPTPVFFVSGCTDVVLQFRIKPKRCSSVDRSFFFISHWHSMQFFALELWLLHCRLDVFFATVTRGQYGSIPSGAIVTAFVANCLIVTMVVAPDPVALVVCVGRHSVLSLLDEYFRSICGLIVYSWSYVCTSLNSWCQRDFCLCTRWRAMTVFIP